jgi:CRP-like cAMP-binding protein
MRTRDEKIADLMKVPLFDALSKKELRTVAAHADEVEVDANYPLTREGDAGNEFGLIITGGAEVRRKGRKLTTLGPGDFFGELSLLAPAPRSATVTTTSPSTILLMHRRDFALVLDSVPAVGRKLLAGLARRLREADRRMDSV